VANLSDALCICAKSIDMHSGAAFAAVQRLQMSFWHGTSQITHQVPPLRCQTLKIGLYTVRINCTPLQLDSFEAHFLSFAQPFDGVAFQTLFISQPVVLFVKLIRLRNTFDVTVWRILQIPLE